MARRKVSIQTVNDPVLNINKTFLRLDNPRKKVVYFIRSDKSIKYTFRRSSRILYIGKTDKRGHKRPLESIRDRAVSFLGLNGVKYLDVVYIKASGKRNVDIADRLEKACLHQFREYYGEVPKGNRKSRNKIELTVEGYYFNLRRLTGIIKEFS